MYSRSGLAKDAKSELFQFLKFHTCSLQLPPWDHEVMSCRILELLIDDNNLDYTPADIRFIENLIRGTPRYFFFLTVFVLPERIGEERGWMYDVVHNSRNGLLQMAT